MHRRGEQSRDLSVGIEKTKTIASFVAPGAQSRARSPADQARRANRGAGDSHVISGFTVEERLRRAETVLTLIADIGRLAATSSDESISADGFAALSTLARQAAQELRTVRQTLPRNVPSLSRAASRSARREASARQPRPESLSHRPRFGLPTPWTELWDITPFKVLDQLRIPGSATREQSR